MPDMPPPVPPPGSSKPSGPQNIEKKAVHPEDAKTDEYLGLTFTSHKDYIEFKAKFLAQMANEMIRLVKAQQDKMVQALKKMKENH